MVIASIILGILFIIAGVYCMVAPINTFFNAMTMFAILMFAFGIHGIIRFFKRRALVPEFIVSILSVIIGFIYLFRPGDTSGGLLILDRVVLFLEAAWFVIKGAVTIYYSVKTRYLNNHWVFQFITGVLSLILGIYSFVYPAVAAQNIGILIGLWYIECGIELIALGTTAGYVQNAVKEVQAEVKEAVDQYNKAANEYAKELNDRFNEAKAAMEKEVKEIPIQSKEETAAPVEPAKDAPAEQPIETVEVVDTKPEKSE